MNTDTNTVLEFKHSTSRGRDTYGYNIVTLYADGVKVARCMGGGYDMRGTCLGDYIQERFQTELLAIRERADWRFDGKNNKQSKRKNTLYGMTLYEEIPARVVLDGAAGFDSMVHVLNAIGYGLSNLRTRGREIYLLQDGTIDTL